jgi:predicted XRE-type DNA-binding protein
MGKPKKTKPIVTRTVDELGEALGLSAAEAAEIEFRSDLSIALARAIGTGQMTHAQIAKRSGTSRTRVTAIANGSTGGISTDVMIRVLSAVGYRAQIKIVRRSQRQRAA